VSVAVLKLCSAYRIREVLERGDDRGFGDLPEGHVQEVRSVAEVVAWRARLPSCSLVQHASPSAFSLLVAPRRRRTGRGPDHGLRRLSCPSRPCPPMTRRCAKATGRVQVTQRAAGELRTASAVGTEN